LLNERDSQCPLVITLSWNIVCRLCEHVNMLLEISETLFSFSCSKQVYKIWELGQHSRYRDWLRAGQPRGWSFSPGGGKNFHFSMSRPALGSTQPPTQWVPGAFSPAVKRPGPEADHSPPTSAEIKKTWVYTSTPPYIFMA
jgi:hypothetical protein